MRSRAGIVLAARGSICPIGPSYIYYDYPYYYSRGHYPTHIGGYVYYRPYYTRSRYRGSESFRRNKARRH
jgi:hypothetical protein